MTSTTELRSIAPPSPARGVVASAPVAAPRQGEEPALRRSRAIGGVLCTLGLALVGVPRLFAAALGLELIAGAFWWWARTAEDRDEQIQRWTWLRRPASALWLAAATQSVLAAADPEMLAMRHDLAELGVWIEAIAVAWAGLELLAALPLARLFSDRPGPLPGIGPWLPVLLPATGFLVLWRQVAHWTSIPPVRITVLVLVLVTAVLASLRAFGRRQMTASLRWLSVADCALAAALVATREVGLQVSVLLWLGAYGGRVALLAGELRGSAPRRNPAASQLWRVSGWIATAALSWPLIISLAFGHPGLSHPAWGIAAGVAITLVAWTAVRRTLDLPERRAMVRREAALPITQVAATVSMLAGPVALVIAWWQGFDPSRRAALVALAPALLGGALAWLRNRQSDATFEARFEAAGNAARVLARQSFRIVITIEHRLVSITWRIGHALMAPTRDLHTGDAQEYLLFLVGLTLLALVLPLLQ
jgi:hypothetical protein